MHPCTLCTRVRAPTCTYVHNVYACTRAREDHQKATGRSYRTKVTGNKVALAKLYTKPLTLKRLLVTLRQSLETRS